MYDSRAAIEAAFDFDPAGFICSPGKFEGEPVWTPYFWEAYLNGDGTEHGDGSLWFDVLPEDVDAFPELRGAFAVTLYCDDSGFVTGAIERNEPCTIDLNRPNIL